MAVSEQTEQTPMQEDNTLDNEAQESTLVRNLIIGIVILAILGGVGYGIKKLLSTKSGPKKNSVTTVKILPDTPPPPPPPPPKEPPKEQPKDQPKEVKEVPQPKPDPAPPAEALKMEGAAGDGPSPFGAGAVSNDYKGGEVATKIGGNGPSQASIFYANKTFNRLQEAINNEKDLTTAQYRVVVYVWVDKDGTIQKIELKRGSGNADTDKLLRSALENIKSMNSPPPPDLPNPIKVEMVSKSTG